jgi:Spy/CpxP family protein refolding chaperone
MTTLGGRLLALLAVAALIAAHSPLRAQPVTGWAPIPTLENVQTGLLQVLSKIHLTHAQHEQVERIIANETFQLALARGNESLSVAKVFAREHAVRLEARRQIEAILTPNQKLRVAKYVVHEMEEDERWGEDRTHYFSIPATY